MKTLAPYLGLYHDHPRRALIAAAAVGCTLTAAGCGGTSSSGSPSSGSSSSGTSSSAVAASSGGTGASGTPAQVISAAAIRSSKITSAAATLTENVGSQETISGSIQEQLKPTLLLDMNLNLSANGTSQVIGGVINDQAIWVKFAQLKAQTGKPWVKIPFSALDKSGSSIAGIFKGLQNINPARQTAWLAGASGVHKAGTQTINGVPTTEYSGSVIPSRAISKMSPALRTALAPGLQAISGQIQFSVWIDGSGHVRKQVLHETAAGQPITTTIVFTAINQPVHITVPPASHTATLPSSVLGRAG